MRVALMHLPKTGGTSLDEYLRAQFPEHRICPERLNRFDRFPDRALARYSYFSAHMDFSTLMRLPGPIYRMTLLRDPKERILSLYYFWRSFTNEEILRHNLKGPRIAKRLSLLEFLTTKAHGIPGNIDNVYLRGLLSEPWRGPNGALSMTEGEALLTAWDNLRLLDRVGFTEEMPSFFAAVAQDLSLPLPDRIPRARSSNDFGRLPGSELVSREPLTPEIHAQLDLLTRLDRVLYEHAREVFLPRLPAAGNGAGA